MSGPAASEARVGPVSPIATEAPGAPARRWRRSWYWYDWANSAFVTTTGTVLFGPYLTAVATEDACPGLAEDATCGTDLRVLGVPVDPGSVAAYTVTVATIVSAILLVFVGALADRSPRPARLLGGFAWTGALAAALMVLVTGSAWELGAILMIVATVALGASLVVYDALLCRIAHPDDRDAVSSRGWALGYLGGGLLLVANLALVSLTPFGLSTGDAVRLCLLSAGLWWAAFTLIPVLGLRRVRGLGRAAPGTGHGIVRGSLGQLRDTFLDLRRYPQTMSFLVAYLFFNDGIQTVIAASAIYAVEEIGFAESQLMALILVVQFVAFGGALLFGLIAARAGAKRTVLGGIGLWTGVVVAAYLLPNGRFLPFVAPRCRHRARPRRDPGPLPLALQPARPGRPGGRVLQPVPGDGARDELVRDADLRPGPSAHGFLPARDHRAHRLLRRRRGAPRPGRRAPRHPRGGQRGARGRLTQCVISITWRRIWVWHPRH